MQNIYWMNTHVSWYVEDKDKGKYTTPFDKYLYSMGTVDKNF
jgi:hypothetical protein